MQVAAAQGQMQIKAPVAWVEVAMEFFMTKVAQDSQEQLILVAGEEGVHQDPPLSPEVSVALELLLFDIPIHLQMPR
jgi:hypothetical protein